jgi:hypothetical protein
MRKVLLAFDGIHFSQGAFEFAKNINEKEAILLTGVFLPQAVYANLWTYADGVGAPIFVNVMDENEEEVINNNVKKFEDLCVRNGIEFRQRKDLNDFALSELKKESRFSDLVIIGSELFYKNMGSGDPNTYIKQALHDLECPAVVVPEKFEFPTTNILTYDGSASSVYAIRHFAYLFPELCDLETVLIFISKDETTPIPFESHIEELAVRHFKNLTVTKLDFDYKKYLSTWIAEKKSAIVVAGAFSRSALSRFFNKSFVADLIKDQKMPVFIVHQ